MWQRQGPKLYVAQKSLSEGNIYGSTRLHMDVTSAVNLMLWAQCQDGTPGWAVWHLFPREASPILRKFLVEDVGCDPENGDPIHSQKICMTAELLERLQAKYNVRPYVVHQRPGQAVFIPAGCAHQVGFVLFHHCIINVNYLSR